MSSTYFHDSQTSAQPRSGGKVSIDRRPPLRITPYHQASACKKGGRSRIPVSVNRLKNSVPYKSELCLLFQKGKCYHGENCHFAHELSEIRQQSSKPVGMEELVRERNGVMRGRECHYFAKGLDCPYGDTCFYQHKCGGNLGGSYSGLNSYGSAGDAIEARSSSGGRNHDKSMFYYKTKLCEKWERDGSCPYEMNCTYAHGREELRQVGYYAKLEKGRDSRIMLGSRSSFAGSCMEGIEAAIKEGKVPIMVWNISKMSQIHADWVGVGHDLPQFC